MTPRPRLGFKTTYVVFLVRFMSSYVCPVLVSVLAISATLVVTMAILHWNYVENNKRKVSKKMIILNHWGKQKPVESDLEKLYVEELLDNKLQRSAKKRYNAFGPISKTVSTYFFKILIPCFVLAKLQTI